MFNHVDVITAKNMMNQVELLGQVPLFITRREGPGLAKNWPNTISLIQLNINLYVSCCLHNLSKTMNNISSEFTRLQVQIPKYCVN